MSEAVGITSVEGERRTRRIVKELVKAGAILVSGLAEGVDTSRTRRGFYVPRWDTSGKPRRRYISALEHAHRGAAHRHDETIVHLEHWTERQLRPFDEPGGDPFVLEDTRPETSGLPSRARSRVGNGPRYE